jgi:hypothetical protein
VKQIMSTTTSALSAATRFPNGPAASAAARSTGICSTSDHTWSST